MEDKSYPSTMRWRTEYMKFNRLPIVLAMITIVAMGFILTLSDSSAERKGEDSDPPEHDDWIIDSLGNYIGNETDWVELVQNEPPAEPTEIPHNDHIDIDGNIIIKNGGELTLFNTTINMTDHNDYTVIIEEGGLLIMEMGDDGNATCMITNNNESHMGSMEINGDLTMNWSSITNVRDIYLNSSQNTISVRNSSFMIYNTFHLNNQNRSFYSTSIYSYIGTVLSLYNSSVFMKGGFFESSSNTTRDNVIHMEDSTMVAEDVQITSGSDENNCIYLEDSTFSAINETAIRAISNGSLIYSIGSYVNLSNVSKANTFGNIFMRFYESHVTISDMKFGVDRRGSNTTRPGLYFRDCDAQFENVNFFRINEIGIEGEDTNLTMQNCNFWNITNNAIQLEGGNIILDTVGFYNIQGDGINLFDINGRMVNVTMDEDDRNHTYGLPFPPIYTSLGYGVQGYGIFAEDSDIDIINSTFSALEMDAVHAIDSTVDIRGSNFRSTGWMDTNDVHGIYMENSKGQITENRFNNPYRGDGFDLFALDMSPMNMTDFVQLNNFSDGRTFQQKFTLFVRVVDGDGDGVVDADVNLSNTYGEDTRITSTTLGGWGRSAFTIPAYEVYRHTKYNETTNETTEYFTNKSFNDHHIIVSKEYKTYNFTVTTERDINISKSMNVEILLNVSTSELIIKSAGVFPRVLQGDNIEIIAVIMNQGEKRVTDVNISYYYALKDTLDWTWFGSDIMDIPGLFNGGNHTQHITTSTVDAPLGIYDFMIVIDPENAVNERNESNNNFTTAQGFQVISRPRIFIDHPLDMEMINGTYLVAGYAEDDYSNDLNIELRIDGVEITVSDTTPTGEMVQWRFNWDTKAYDFTQGKDKYPNGQHIISARCSNNNPSGFDRSDWYDITVIVANTPELHFLHPEDGEFVNVSGTMALYPVEIKVEVFHDLSSVKFKMDNGSWQGMNLLGTVFKSMLDTSKYMDGYHTLSFNASWGYGTITETVSILLNSPNKDSLPVIEADYTLTDDDFTVQGTTTDDFKVEWVEIRLDDDPWILLNQSQANFATFQHSWERRLLTPDSHSFSVRAFDGFDTVDLTIWFPVYILYDLTILDIEIPTNVSEDDWVNFTVVVENTGPYASPEGSLILYIGNIMRTVDGLSIPAHTKQNIFISWRARPGNHTISAEINPTQKNDETDPSNNIHVDDPLLVKETYVPESEDETDITSYLIVAAIITVILGIVAGAAFISSGKKKKDEIPPPPPMP